MKKPSHAANQVTVLPRKHSLLWLLYILVLVPAICQASTVATPTFSPAAGTYTSIQTVTISDATSGATIYYTTNGSTPTTSSTQYTSPIAVSSTETVKAIGTKTGFTKSAVGSAAYTIHLTAATPSFMPTAGTYTSTQTVTISDATSGAVIYYTTNGSTPTTSSTQYTGSITVSSSETVKAIATASGYSQSAVGSGAYTIILPLATPTFSPAAGTYTSTQTVTIGEATSGATIYYTTNGSTPTTSSTQYTGPITVSSSETIEAIATATGYSQSAVSTAAYTINSSSSPTWTHIQGNSAANSSSVTSLTLTLPSNPGAGHDVLVGIEFDCCASVAVSNVSVHDGNGNWYIMSPHSPFLDPDTSINGSVYLFGLLNAPSNASQTLYINWTTAIDAVGWADEFSSSSGTSAFDADIGATSVFSGTALNWPTITPAGSNELFYALEFASNSVTAPAAGASAGPWVGAAGGIDTIATGGAAEYDLSASGSTAPNFTDTAAGATAIVAALAISAAPGIPTPAPSTCGNLSQLDTDDGNALDQLGVPCVTGSNAGGYTVSTVSYWAGSPTSTSVDLGVYADSSGTPGALLCHASTGTITPTAGWNSVNISGCPTLSAGTRYWMGYITGSNQIQQGTTPGVCPGTALSNVWANASPSSAALSSPFGASSPSTNWCYSLYMTLNPVAASNACGETAQSGLDWQNARLGVATPCVTGTNVGGYTVSSLSYWAGAPTSTSFDLGVYSDSSGSPGSLLCHAATGAITPAAGWNSINISSCPTLSASTKYWVGYVDGSDQIQQGTVSGTCTGTSNYTVFSNGVLPGVSLANPFGADSATSSCYSLYMTLSTGNQSSPTLTVSSSVNPASYGQPVSLTATISSGPTGLVTFYSDGTQIGQALISGTTAALTTTGLPLGSHSITASWPGNANYQSVSSSPITQTINVDTPAITWPTPAPLAYGLPLSATQLNATANASGTFVYTPASGTVLSPGTHTLSVTFTPTDMTDYTTATNTVTLNVPIAPPAGIITTVAGDGGYGSSGDGGLAVNAELESPEQIAVDSTGNIYLPDSYVGVVRKVVASTGIITTIAGTGTEGYSGDGGQATSAQLNTPMAIALDAAGNVYVADSQSNRIRKITVSTGVTTTIAGTGTAGYSGDGGPSTSAQINDPVGVTFDSAGNLYIADTQNNVVREVAASTGIITTVAGNSFSGYSGDGGPATSAQLWGPESIAFDSSGNLYIADSYNQVIREVNHSSGTISTIAGNRTAGYTGDNGPATSAELNYPYAISVDATGNVYISDYANFVIRMVSPTGIITSVAGNGTSGFSGDGGPATSAQLSYPHGVALDSAGNLYIGDCGNHRVRVIGGASQAQVSVSVVPASATLYAQQTKQFTATVTNTSNTAVTWSNSPAGAGGISSSGLYTAPASISTQQTVTVTATSQANSTISGSAAVTLVPTIAVNVTPSAATLYGGQSQAFAATVTNTSNTAVTWSISPSGTGSIDQSGNYTAPATITTQQAITITATSQADTTKSANATAYLLPPCVSNGYTYVRTIVIDHTKVPNTDQANFPFLFSSTDPLLKTLSNGGHVTNTNGYDIIFASDPQGLNKLDFELEQYNPATGQVIAWMRVPAVSHTTDTVVYLFYGNANITATQANPTGVWSNGYSGVWHLISGNTGTSADSTNNQSGTNLNTTAATGPIAGAATGFNGETSYVNVAGGGGLAGASQGTISMWVQWAGNSQEPGGGGTYGAIIGRQSNSIFSNDILALSGANPSSATLEWLSVTGFPTLTGVTPVGNVWDLVDVTFGPNGQALYLNGHLEANNFTSITLNGDTSVPLTIGAWIDDGRSYLNGSIEEVHVSTAARSADWVTTEFNNQHSPQTFYSLTSESTLTINPGAVSLYGSQSQQFSVFVGCSSPAIWSMPADSPGTLSGDGLYTAPTIVTAQQNVTIIATSTADPSKMGSALVTLLPQPLSPILTLTASALPPYVIGTTQQFVATFTNHDGSPLVGAPVTFTVTGANSVSFSGTTDNNGKASFSYAGVNSGNDTIQASTTVDGENATSNSLTASWIVPSNPISTNTVLGRFFSYPTGSCCTFTATPATPPVFEQVFPTINFNPPSGSVPGNTTVTVSTSPFTDVTVDNNGNFSGTIVAQGNGYQPFAASLPGFQAVFTGSFIVANGGDLVIPVFVDNAFILGIGGGATLVGGPTNAFTPFNQYPVMEELSTSIGGTSATVHFPGPGTYPFELDYVQDGLGFASLMMMTGSETNGLAPGVPSGSTLVLSPGSVLNQPVGGRQTFTVVATDAAGNPVPNLSLGLVVSQDDILDLSATTNSSGTATFSYVNSSPGTDQVQAVALIDGQLAYSNAVSVPWTLPPSSGTGSGSSGPLSVSISAENTIILPSTLALSGSATDSALPQGDSITTTWSMVSGPGTVTFTNPQQVSTSASFSEPGSYELQLAASDVNGSTSAQLTVAVNPAPGVTQGWIGSPAYGSAVFCIVPITVASGETLASGTLTFYPDNNPNNVTVLNANTTGSGQIGTWDTTVLNNGTYWITLQATDTHGDSEYNLDLVTVTGNCKPGRITSTVTDLIVPANGLSISIQRTYDSLNAATVGDFGYGWNLSTNVNLTVDPKGDVTFTLGGIRRTFYLTPVNDGFLPFYDILYTAEPGLHGTLTSNGPGCSDLFNFVIPDGSLWDCIDGGLYSPPGYIYTDPSGTEYLIGVNGKLQSIIDKNGNALTINANGITSSSGLSVPFVRDSSGRITEITDPQGNHYQYSYDDNGNLASVTYPNISQASTYTYNSNHLYLSGTDFRGNALPTTAYYGASDTDPNGLPLNGRLKSVTDASSETTSYAYNLTTNTTTITYPPDAGGNVGTATMVYDTLGDLLSSTDPLGHTTANTYDVNQNLLSTVDPLGHTTSYTYDTNGNKTSTTYPATATSTNTTSTIVYNQFSEPTSTTDELGNQRNFNYDVNFNPQNVTDNLGTLASFAFNTDGTMQSGTVGFDISSQPSMASQFTYDTNGNLTARTDALGRTTSYTYDSLGHKLSMTEPLPNSSTSPSAATTNYTYDPFGNLTQTTAPLGRTTSSTYDGNGNKLSDTDARGNTTNYQDDALNRLVLTTYPDSTTSSKTYDFRGNVITETNQAGHVTKHVYDLAGRQTSVTQAYGTSNATTTSYTYDNDGRKLSETDSLGHTTNYTYDAAGNLTGTSGVAGAFTYAYDNARNRVSMTDGNSHTTSYQYDARKRLVLTTYPDQTTKTNAYDGPGNLISVTDQAGNIVEYSYDAANQLQKVTQANSPDSSANTTIVGYDADGNPIVLTDANSHATASSFDLADELTEKTLPDGSLTESRSYDPAGNLLSVTHFNGTTTSYTYDSLSRLLSRATPGETTVSFTYTATGKRHTMADASGTTTYGYDSMDRLTSKATPEGTLSYTYDADGHLASTASNHTNGVSVSYTYDTLNRLGTVVDTHLGTTSYTYDSASNLATATYPNDIQTTFTYDTLNRVTGLGSQLGNYTYQLGATGNRTSASESSGRSVTWSYDGIYRLTNETISGAPSGKNGTVAYGLDPVGNRTSETSSLSGIPSGSSTFTPDDEVSGETYDNNGNTTFTSGKTFTYDSENHLMSMGSTVALLYDGDGNRVAKSVNGVTTYYLVDDLNPTGYPQVVEELSGAGAVERVYTYGVQRISQDQVISNAWTPSFYGYDGGGSVRALTNAAGAVTDTYDYDAFGNLLNPASSGTPNNYLYRGEQWDADLGLYYLRARYYNPLTGRFMSRDPDDHSPYDPASLHKYLYAKGDPVDGVDPSGRGLLDGVYIEVETGIPWISTAAKVSLTIGAVLCKAADWLSWISTHLAGGPPIEVPEPWPLFCLTR